MRALDEDALVCDFAEYYHIYDYRALDPGYAAVLACGLRPESRIMMKLSGEKYTKTEMLLMASLDTQNMIMWISAQKGNKRKIRKPESVMRKLMGKEQDVKKEKTKLFNSGADFKAARQRLIEKVKKHGV